MKEENKTINLQEEKEEKIDIQQILFKYLIH